MLRKLPGPFFGWLGVLMFLLLMQFLIRWLPEIAGKGIPFTVIVELIAYNLAYMVVLAVPMATLLAALMAFGQMVESKAYTVMKGAGISFGQLVWPALVVGLFVTGFMVYFNTVMLPESNHRARMLWADIRMQQPGFELRPGVFYEGIEDYSILVRERPEGSNELRGITIYDYTEGRRQQAVIRASHGTLESDSLGREITMVLYDGEMHRPLARDANHTEERYEKMRFEQHTLRLDISDFGFQRADDRERRTSRTARTMRIAGLQSAIDSLRSEIAIDRDGLRDSPHHPYGPRADLDSVGGWPPPDTLDAAPLDADTLDSEASMPLLLRDIPVDRHPNIVDNALQRTRSLQSELRSTGRSIEWKDERIRTYRVEIMKKYSIAVACVVFIFIGAPLGLSIRRGSLGVSAGFAMGIFLFYWITLVQGEKLADRAIIAPWFGMWIANMIMMVVGTWLVVYIVMDLRATPPLRTRLWTWLRSLWSADNPS